MNFIKHRLPLSDKTNYYVNEQKFLQKQSPNEEHCRIQSQQNSNEQSYNNSYEKGSQKVKLKLKTISLRQKPMKQNANKRIDLNKKNTPNQTNKQNSINAVANSEKRNKSNFYFKPCVVNFQLKATHTQISKIDTFEVKSPKINVKNQISKQKTKIKNYPLLKLLSQISHIFMQIFLANSSEELNYKNIASYTLQYSDLMCILHGLNLIKYETQSQYQIQHQDQKEELQKIYFLWKILRSNSFEYFKLNIFNVSTLLVSIINVQLQSIEIFIDLLMQKIIQSKQKRNIIDMINKKCQTKVKQPSHIFFIRNIKLLGSLKRVTYQKFEFFSIGIQQQTQISKEFEKFKLNRLNYQKNINKEKQNIQTQNTQKIQLHSLISPKSNELALTKRLKIIKQLENHTKQSEQTKKNHLQNQPNIFLIYKSTQKCKKTQQIKLKQINSLNFKKDQLQNKNRKQPTMNQYIPSQKMKFSELKSLQMMQKGRKIKSDKQQILKKGWTNSGQVSARQSRACSTKSSCKTQAQIVKTLKSQESCRNIFKRNQQKKNFFQKSKQQFNKTSERKNDKSEEYMIKEKEKVKIKNNFTNFDSQKQIQTQQKSKNHNKLFIKTYYESQTPSIYQAGSTHTMSMDDNQSLNLETQNNCEQNDFMLQDNSMIDQMQDQLTDNHQRLFTEQYSERQSQRITQNFETLPTGNTEANEQVEQAQQRKQINSQNAKDGQRQRASNQNTRVIKSYLKIPILYVDVNMDESKKQRIIIFQQDNPIDLAKQFGKKHKLDANMIQKLEEMLTDQINGILGRIDEQEQEYDETKQQIYDNQEQQQQLQNTNQH